MACWWRAATSSECCAAAVGAGKHGWRLPGWRGLRCLDRHSLCCAGVPPLCAAMMLPLRLPCFAACRVDESHLTGEPDDVAKDPRTRASLLGGSKVLSGFGRMLVTSVGPNSQASTEWHSAMFSPLLLCGVCGAGATCCCRFHGNLRRLMRMESAAASWCACT